MSDYGVKEYESVTILRLIGSIAVMAGVAVLAYCAMGIAILTWAWGVLP
jgi:hypothetical protein